MKSHIRNDKSKYKSYNYTDNSILCNYLKNLSDILKFT